MSQVQGAGEAARGASVGKDGVMVMLPWDCSVSSYQWRDGGPYDSGLRQRISLHCKSRQNEHPMLNYLAAYGAIALVMLALDVVWLGVIAKSLYRDGIGHLMADPPNLVAGGVFYLLYPVGVLLFAVAPAALSGELAAPAVGAWQRAVLAGALFGFFCYATYDLSNLATLRGWPWRLVLVDIAWGTALTAAAAAGGRWALGRMSH